MATETASHNLPAQLSSFFGREAEVEEVKRLLGTTRLLTLTGAGGVGKTRLALEVGVRVLDECPDGVWLVELAALSDPDFLAQTVATALGMRETPGRSPMDAVLVYLHERAAVLLLDNCEHLIAACARLVDTLLRACSRVRILATSREALAIAGETAWRVPSLRLPDPARGEANFEVLLGNEAVRLFAERAAAALPGFTLTESNAYAVARVCRRLDGIPLAIELAAARVRAFSVEEVESRLDDRFRLLTGGSRAALPRQQTLRAAVDWSYDLLSQGERALLRRLSVFAGGWTLAAAESVCAGGGLESGDVLDLLPQLVDKSLIVAEGRGGETRYGLLETIRQYARDRHLESGEAESVRDRHLGYFLDLAEEGDAHLRGPEQMSWLGRLEGEHDNLRAALAWCREPTGDAVKGLRLAGALAYFWFIRGYWTEGHRWLRDSLAQVEAPGLAEADRRARARALVGVALVPDMRDFRFGLTGAEHGLALYREIGDRRGAAFALTILSIAAGVGRDPARARALAEESVALWRELGGTWDLAWAATNLGERAYRLGDDAAARAAYEEALALYREAGERYLIAGPLVGLGEVALREGDLPRAKKLFAEALASAREVDYKQFVALAGRRLARIALVEGDYQTATAHLRESLQTLRDFGELGLATSWLLDFAEIAAAVGRSVGAARLLGAADALQESRGAETRLFRSRFERQVPAVRATLPEAEFAAAWAEGAAMTPDQALAEAREFAGTLQPDEEQLVAAPAPPDVSRPDANPNGLTEREVEVLRLLSQGLTSAQIGENLVISVVTVNTHLRNIYGKIGVNSRTAAARWAIENGLA
jgi:non-specific serine/threonine protein kinase